MLTENEKVKMSCEHRPVNEKTVQKWTEKNERFYLEKCQTTHAFKTRKTRKKVLMLVFFGPFTRFFSLLKMKKNQKNQKSIRKITFFPVFPYALRPFFPNHSHYTKC